MLSSSVNQYLSVRLLRRRGGCIDLQFSCIDFCAGFGMYVYAHVFFVGGTVVANIAAHRAVIASRSGLVYDEEKQDGDDGGGVYRI